MCSQICKVIQSPSIYITILERQDRVWSPIEDDLQTGAVHKAVAKRLKIPRAAEGLTFDDEMIDLLWPKLGQNLQVVETFLEEFVFPKETRQFPFKAHCCMKGPR